MFNNKFINFGHLSLASIIFGMAISVSLVHAELPLDSYNDSTPTYIVSISAQQEIAEGNTGAEDIEEYGFYINGMTSANCEVKVRDALLKCAGVKDVFTSLDDGFTIIEVDNGKMNSEEIISAIGKAGYEIIEDE
jgi:copper chaperone CopZ